MKYLFSVTKGLAACTGTALMVYAMSTSADSCDIVRGKQVYTKCSACHSLQADQHMMGPSLYQIIGGTAGSAKGFRYSASMRDSSIVWTISNLDRFLTSPTEFLPGNSMPFGGLRNATDRAALLCLLNTNPTTESNSE